MNSTDPRFDSIKDYFVGDYFANVGTEFIPDAPIHCPGCKGQIALATAVNDDNDTGPTEGALLVCAECFTTSIIDNDVPRLLTDEEVVDVAQDYGFQQLMKALQGR